LSILLPCVNKVPQLADVPKSIYPYLATSFYNLIPSCPRCNGFGAKGSQDSYTDELKNPYEIKDNDRPGYLDNSTYGLVMFAPDLQDLSIELTVNMLNHVNPYTGVRYADESSLAFIEMQNEDNIFFPATHDAILKCPTYKKMICEQFSNWLLEKYGDEFSFLKADGNQSIFCVSTKLSKSL